MDLEEDISFLISKDAFTLANKLRKVENFLESEASRPKCGPNVDNALKDTEFLVKSLEDQLNHPSKRQELKLAIGKVVKDKESAPGKKCFLEWGRVWLNDVLENEDISTTV